MSDTGLFQRIGTRLTGLFVDQEQETPESPRPHQSLLAAQARERASNDVFEQQVKELLGHDTHALAGRANLIGLAKIRAKLGVEWEKVAGRADEIARHAIERRLTDADVYTRYKEINYLIVFAQLTKKQAQLKCALIAEEITKRLLGEGSDRSLLEVKTMVSNLGSREPEFEDVPNIDTLAAQLSGIDVCEVGAEADSKVVASGSEAKPKALENSHKTAPAENSPAVDPAVVGLPQAWERRGGAADPIDSLRIAYRPLWDVKNAAVTGYECTPTWKGAGGRLITDESEVLQFEKPALTNQLDVIVLRQAITDLRNEISAGRRFQLVIPVHFDTLASYSQRIGYIERCYRGIGAELRKYVLFKIVGAPEGAPTTRLSEICGALHHHARAISLRLPPNSRCLPPTETGLSAICYHINPANVESAEITNVGRLVNEARRQRLGSFVYNVDTLSVATASIGAGANYLVGTAVGPIVDHPGQIYRFDITDLYKGKLHAAPTAMAS